MSSRRTIALLLLVLQVLACTSWKPSKLTPAQAVEGRREIRVHLADGSQVAVLDPWIRTDSLGGAQLAVIVGATGIRARTEPLPLDSIASIRTQQFDVWRTVTVIVMGATVVAAIAWAVTCANQEPGEKLIDLCPR